MPIGFLRRDRKGMALDGRGDGKELGGAERGEIVIRACCIIKVYFQQKEKKEAFLLVCLCCLFIFCDAFGFYIRIILES